MKIAIGSKLFEGAWGGGNLFVKSFKNYLQEKKIKVTHYLNESDIDIILLTEPRFESSSSTITLLEAKLYKRFVNNKVKIIHRINECDERKNTNYVNKKMTHISKNSDYTIFVSHWLKTLYEEFGLIKHNSKVILSGSDGKIFNTQNKKVWDGKSKLKIITHHWGNNWNKGFDVYSRIDILLDNSKFNEKFSFTYIGNLPKNFFFKNVIYKKPLISEELSKELKSHDLYITGSLNEPSGNHQIEASLCGLPVMYINSGGIPDYQNNFGTEFNLNNLEIILEDVYKNYSKYYSKNLNFPFDAKLMNSEYFKLIESIYEKSTHIKKYYIYLLFYRFLFRLKIIELFKLFFSKINYKLNKYILKNI